MRFVLLPFAFCMILLTQVCLARGFVTCPIGSTKSVYKSNSCSAIQKSTAFSSTIQVRGGSSSTARDLVINPAVLSVVAGSLAGAIGVGVSFPLDSLKTKSQLLQSSSSSSSSSGNAVNADGTAAVTPAERKLNMFQLMALVWEREGLSGFFNGVKGAMIGQAVIKALAFSTNSNTITFLQNHEISHHWPSVVVLLVASCWAGFVTSFFVAPIERIKINMQADAGKYSNELDCLKSIVKFEGFKGLLTRGLGATLVREVPSYGLYFWLYGVLSHSVWAQSFLPAPVLPLVIGALSGMASWIPVYPTDTIKTILQNTNADINSPTSDASFFDVAKGLYERGGIGAFFDGLDAKLMRAAVNHAVTFYIYENIMQNFVNS